MIDDIIYDCSLSDLELIECSSSGDYYLFSKTFSGKEFYFKDHMIGGISLLPGVACLELARASYGLLNEKSSFPNQIKNMTWLKPLLPTIQQVFLKLEKKINFWEFSLISGIGEKQILHNQAQLTHTVLSHAQSINLEQLLQQKANKYSKSQFYKMGESLEAKLGPSFQGVKWIKLLNNYESISYIRLPFVLDNNKSGRHFCWHPSMIDGAIQPAMIGSSLANSLYEGWVYYPFTLTTMNIYIHGQFPLECYTYVKNKTVKNSNIIKFDIVISDIDGCKIADFNNLLSIRKKKTPIANSIV